MRIRLERSRPIGYLIIEQTQDGDETGAGRIDGRSVLVQSDQDYPSTAASFGFSLSSVQQQNRAYYGLRPCDHSSTDGTIVCPDCGLLPLTFIEAAASWMDENEGATAEDPGYFEQEQSEAETAEARPRIGG